MKKLFLLFVVSLVLLVSKTKADTYGSDVSFNFFYSSLSPYGEWIEVDRDLYAWRPYDVSSNWQPYTEGRWIWSDYGWYWDSYEPFGWAVYHYGRWYYDDYYGWLWLPDNDWGPSWVEWRYNDDYVGWAPLPPYAVFRAGVGIHFTYDWHFPVRFWNYVPCTHFYDYDVIHYRVSSRMRHRIFNETRYRNNYDYRDGRVINQGIDRGMIERRSGRRIEERNVSVTSRLRDYEGSRTTRGGVIGDRNRVEVYRPSDRDLEKSRDISNIDIKRPERRTSLETSRVEMRDMGRDVRRNSETIQRDRDLNKSPEQNNSIRPERNNTSRPETNNPANRTDQNEGRNRRSNDYTPESRPERSNGNVEQRRNNQPNVINERRPENKTSNDTRRREEMQSHGNPQQNSAPQVRERRTEDRRSEERRSENQGQNRQEERSNDNTRERRR